MKTSASLCRTEVRFESEHGPNNKGIGSRECEFSTPAHPFAASAVIGRDHRHAGRKALDDRQAEPLRSARQHGHTEEVVEPVQLGVAERLVQAEVRPAYVRFALQSVSSQQRIGSHGG